MKSTYKKAVELEKKAWKSYLDKVDKDVMRFFAPDIL